MFIRIIRARARPGRVDEYARQWQSLFVPRLVEVAGFRHAYFAGDRALNTIAVVTLWDDLPRATVLGPLIAGFEDLVKELMAAPSVIDEYEVLAETQRAP